MLTSFKSVTSSEGKVALTHPTSNIETQTLRGMNTHYYTECTLQKLQLWSKSIKVRI